MLGGRRGAITLIKRSDFCETRYKRVKQHDFKYEDQPDRSVQRGIF